MSTLNEDLEFSKNWENDEDFPTREYNEATVRENIQLLFDEIKDHINNKVTPAINDNMDRITSMGGGGMITHDLLDDECVEENNIKRGAITEYKYGPTSIPTSAFKNSSITAEKLHTATVNPYIDGRIDAKTDSMLSSTSTNPVRNSVVKSALDTKAPIASPTLTGTPKAPTAANSTNNTQIATTAFVHNYAQPITGTATTSAAGLMSAADKTKLNGIATGAEVNQNAFSNVKVGSTTVSADGKTDTLELVAGSNVTLTPDATNDKVTIASTNTTYSAATTSTAGLMSAADKTKLNGIATGANAYSLPTASSSTLGGVKTGSNITNSSGTISVSSSNVTNALGYTPLANKFVQNGTGYVESKSGSIELGVDYNWSETDVRDEVWLYMTTASSSSSSTSPQIRVHGDIRPSDTSTWDCGWSSYRWDNVYADSVNSGSDRRMKKDIDYDMSKYLEFFDSLRPCHFRYINKDGEEHTGIIAQEVVESLKDINTEDSAIINSATDDGMLNARYDEFIGILIAKVQDLQRQVDELKAGDK